MKIKNRDLMFRDWLTPILKESRVYSQFCSLQKQFQDQHRAATMRSIPACRAYGWKMAAQQFGDLWSKEEFEAYRSEILNEARARREKESMIRAREESRQTNKDLPKMTEKQAESLLEASKSNSTQNTPDDTVFIEGGHEGDILADTKWVYFNLARLIKKRRTGERYLDTRILKEAPSNGAVGMAQYALEDNKAFFEKFVVKILPKDTGPKESRSEEDIKAELDPTLDDLAKYIVRSTK